MLGKSVSPSRMYVAICVKSNFDGHYFRKFRLPDAHMEDVLLDGSWIQAGKGLANTAETAAWYFLNVLNYSACIEGCVSFEDFQNLEDEPTCEEKWARAEASASYDPPSCAPRPISSGGAR